jgi:hypothetical protein
MLRHSTGYKLANDGHNTRSLAHYLGHHNLHGTLHCVSVRSFCAFLAGLKRCSENVRRNPFFEDWNGPTSSQKDHSRSD